MSEQTTPSEAGSDSASKPGVGEINDNTLSNVAIPEINKLLVERINPDFGILDKLLASKALSRTEVEQVKNLGTSHEKNSRLIELITKNEKLTELFNALKETHQEHLVNYVTAKGVYSEDYGGAWPLTERETSILDVNQESLIDLMDVTSNEIINQLYSVKVLNKRQKEFICKQPYDYDKSEALLSILFRSSLSDYWKMISCLGATNQQRAAKILLEGGALVQIHNTVDGEKEAATAAEIEIVARIESILSNMNIEESTRILERLHLRVFAARVGHSVSLYILCETTDELMHLSNLLTSGELQRGIEILFNKVVIRSERVNVFTTVSEETLAKCKKFLEVDHSEDEVSGKAILKLCEQMKVEEERRTEEEEEEETMEVEERIEEEEVEAEEEEDTVDAEESHPVVEEMQAEAAGYADYEEEADMQKGGGPGRKLGPRTGFEIMAAILRNNTDYFLEYIRPRGLIDRLHALGCLTDEETRYIKTLKEDVDKNDEILKVIRGLGLEKYNVLIDLLRTLDQSLVAEVAEKGGVVMKATISNEEIEDLQRIENQLVERINQLLNKTSSRSTKLVQFLSLLGRGNIQILNARWEYGIIVWFWCRSVKALKAIDDMNESDEEQLTKVMTELFKILLNGEHVPEITNIDLEDPDKMLVVKTSSLCHEEDMPVPKGSACAVTMLDSNIYILCQKPSSILVFDKRDLSKHSSEIPLTDITDPVDMVALQQSSCLYITDKGNSSVWKFTPSGSSVTPWLQNISSPYTLSATSTGGVIRVAQGHPSHLEIYSADAQRIDHIKLSDIVKVPHHAVETKAGTYVISYGESSGNNGVCEITKDGSVISVFDTLLEAVEGIDPNVNKLLKETFAEKKLVCCPRYLAVNEHGEIYATDPDNGRLMVFDSRLKLEAVVEKASFKKPMNVHCLKNMRRLLIVYCKEEQQTVGLFNQKLT